MGHGIHATTTGPLGAGLPARDSSVTSKPSGSALSAALSQVVASMAKDMIAVRIGPDFRMAVVGAPSYFTRVWALAAQGFSGGGSRNGNGCSRSRLTSRGSGA